MITREVAIRTHAEDRARVSWRIHQNPARKPDPEDWLSFDKNFSPTEVSMFTSHWDETMQGLKAAYNAFVAHAHAFEPSLLTKPRFEDIVVLRVLGEIKSRLGPLGQSTRLFQSPTDFSWEERKPPTRAVGDEAFQQSREIAYKIAQEVRCRVLEAVEGVYRPESLLLKVGPIARVEEFREELFTAVLVSAESPITRTVVLAVYAERL